MTFVFKLLFKRSGLDYSASIYKAALDSLAVYIDVTWLKTDVRDIMDMKDEVNDTFI